MQPLSLNEIAKKQRCPIPMGTDEERVAWCSSNRRACAATLGQLDPTEWRHPKRLSNTWLALYHVLNCCIEFLDSP